jgi:hypothetical protein
LKIERFFSFFLRSFLASSACFDACDLSDNWSSLSEVMADEMKKEVEEWELAGDWLIC